MVSANGTLTRSSLSLGHSGEVLFGDGRLCGVDGEPLREVGVTRRHRVGQSQQVHLVQTGESGQVSVRKEAGQQPALETRG